MKKRIPSFLAGMLTTALVCGLTVSALAANGLISINAALNNIAIEVNSKPTIAKGENYTTDSGSETAGSILYNETTYVPLRKVAELLGAEIKWDASTGTANIVGQVEAPVAPTTPPDTTAPPADYSDWTPEEEAAYQEFKGMWDVKRIWIEDFREIGSPFGPEVNYIRQVELVYNGVMTYEECEEILLKNDAMYLFYLRMCHDYEITEYVEGALKGTRIAFIFVDSESPWLGSPLCSTMLSPNKFYVLNSRMEYAFPLIEFR